MPQEFKNYTDFVVVDYKDMKFIFNPYTQGIGLWHYMSRDNKPVKIAENHLQKELNAHFFGSVTLPPIFERFLKAPKEDKEKLAEVSLGWLQLKIKALQTNVQNENIKTINASYNNKFVMGGMYFYLYDAYHKDELPYWDKFPLMILLERKNLKNGPGFMGLNLHYLPTDMRLIFLNKLLDTRSIYNKQTDMIKLRITYDFLKSTVSLKEFKPCVKFYLLEQIKSKILPIQSHEWVFAAGLNVEKFQKKSRETVWKDSRKIIRSS
jgi:hypothetical protein